jgi:hypothetical protein
MTNNPKDKQREANKRFLAKHGKEYIATAHQRHIDKMNGADIKDRRLKVANECTIVSDPDESCNFNKGAVVDNVKEMLASGSFSNGTVVNKLGKLYRVSGVINQKLVLVNDA